MSHKVKTIADELLDNAEKANRFAHGATRSERRALRREAQKGKAIEPQQGYFYRPERYKKLSKRARVIYLIRSMSAVHPQWTFAAFSAALVYGLQVSHTLIGSVHLAVSPRQNRRKMPAATICHVVEGDEPRVVDGIRVTSLARTLLDCMCLTSFRYGLAIVDSALHWKLIEEPVLKGYVKKNGGGRHGISCARKVLEHMDGKSENGGESIVRAIMIELGFETPELQVEIADPMLDGAVRRVDYYWLRKDGGAVIGELDGKIKYKGDQAGHSADIDRALEGAIETLTEERLRESHLNLTGMTVVRFSFKQATDESYFEKLLTRAGVPKCEEEGPDA